jgi:hypothetical protein
MQQTVKELLLGVLMLAVFPLAAEPVNSDMAKVVTGTARPADCLAPLAVNKIDGQMRSVPAQGFLIEPGVHTINGRATLNIASCPIKDRKLQISSTPDLEMNFETGKTYYIAYDHSQDNAEDWALVVWKVEQSGLAVFEFRRD